MIRSEFAALAALGPLPAARSADGAKLFEQEKLLGAIQKPISDDEAKLLIKLFGPDDCHGTRWTLWHLIESAPGWPMVDCLEDSSNEWLCPLRDRANRAA